MIIETISDYLEEVFQSKPRLGTLTIKERGETYLNPGKKPLCTHKYYFKMPNTHSLLCGVIDLFDHFASLIDYTKHDNSIFYYSEPTFTDSLVERLEYKLHKWGRHDEQLLADSNRLSLPLPQNEPSHS